MIHFSEKKNRELHKSIPKMWELLQIRILQTNSKIVETHTFRKFFLNRTRVKIGLSFS